MDYEDALWEGAGCFNMCSKCGRAFGGKYWWDRDKGTAFSDSALSHLDQSLEAFTAKTSKKSAGACHWRCLVEWAQLEQAKNAELHNKKKDGNANRMWDHMSKEFGENWRDWPVVGCGTGFAPWKKGPSMVLVMETEKNKHMSIIAERPPTEVAQAFKRTRAMAAKEVLGNLDLTKLYNMLSNSYPMDKEFTDNSNYQNKYILGVSKYPIVKWKEIDREYMSVMSWIRFAYLVAAGHNNEIMNELREISFAIDSDDPDVRTYNGSMTKKRLLKMAREKMMTKKIPTTVEEVDLLGKYVSRVAI